MIGRFEAIQRLFGERDNVISHGRIRVVRA